MQVWADSGRSVVVRCTRFGGRSEQKVTINRSKRERGRELFLEPPLVTRQRASQTEPQRKT